MNPHKIHLVRYADDFVITCNSKEKAEEIVTKLTQFLEERGLELAGEKTLITHIDNGFDFLGYNFKRWEDGKVRVKPSGQSVKRLKEELKRTVVKLKAAKQDALIEALNPKITGWAMYHRNFVSKETFYDIDHYLWIILWKWARGRHPNKGKVWIHGKYWKRSETRWEFRGEESTLTTLGDIKIVRHTNLKREMNPYLNPEYFQKRQGKNRSRKGELCSARAVCGESRTHGSKKGVDEQSSTPIRQRSYKWADFKVSDYLADAPPEVIEGLGNSLFSKITGEDDDYSEAMCNWITAPEFSEYKQPVYLKRSRNLTRTPAGEVRDLRDSYQRLIDMGLIEADPSIHLTWTKESNVRKIGHCSVLMKVISISSVLDTDMIPEFVLDYCLYHELCHMIIGFDPTAKRHGEEFSELEAKFEKRDEAEDWLKRLCMYI